MADARRVPAKKAPPRRRPAPSVPETLTPEDREWVDRQMSIGTHDVQAEVEGVVIDDGQKVELLGATFRIADSIGLMPLLRFAHASSKGLDSNDMEGMAALYEMIRDCIDQTRPQEKRPDPDTGEMRMVDAGPSEWDRFQAHATDTKAEADDLLAVVQKVIEKVTARKAKPRSGSSAGRRPTSRSSRGSSPSPAIEGMTPIDDLGRST